MSNRDNGSRTPALPVAIIGAGPVGLAAAAHLASRDQPFVVLEAGPSVGAHVSAWRHVQVFSPWRYNIDPVAASMLKATGWKEPDPDVLPTGGELVAEYLRPLGALPQIAPHLRLGTRVLAVARTGCDKMKTAGRDEAPFEIRVRGTAGEDTLLARAVIDASGTYAAPNPLGANGLARHRRGSMRRPHLLRHPRRRRRPPCPLRRSGRPRRGQWALRVQHAPRPARPRRGRTRDDDHVGGAPDGPRGHVRRRRGRRAPRPGQPGRPPSPPRRVGARATGVRLSDASAPARWNARDRPRRAGPRPRPVRRDHRGDGVPAGPGDAR